METEAASVTALRDAVERNITAEKERISQIEEAAKQAKATEEKLTQEKLALQKTAEE